MSRSMQAKFQVLNVDRQYAGQETIYFQPVSSKPYGPNGESEDNTYAKYTPSGSCNLTVNNPELLGVYKEGQKFYVNFVPAAE